MFTIDVSFVDTKNVIFLIIFFFKSSSNVFIYPIAVEYPSMHQCFHFLISMEELSRSKKLIWSQFYILRVVENSDISVELHQLMWVQKFELLTNLIINVVYLF